MTPGTPRQSDCVDVHEDAVDAGASPAPATLIGVDFGSRPPTFVPARSEIAKDGTVTMRTTHFPPIYRAGDMGWAEGAGKTRSGFAFTFGVDLDGPIVSPYRAKQRSARRVRMARKKRRGW